MEYDVILQSVLDDIDRRITQNITIEELACASHYSIYHFCRLFMARTGTPVMTYVIRRKLEYALYDLSQGRKIIDVATNYGFETHAGFTKAFKKCFGYPPSLFHLHVSAHQPQRMTVRSFQIKKGENTMQVQIKEIPSFAVAGVVSRHALPNVSRAADIPAFWHTISMDYGKHLSRAYDAFTPAKHGEFGLCFDVDESTGEFTYMLGVTFDPNADEGHIEEDMRKLEIPGGLYAVFTTPKVPDEQYAQSIADTWAKALTCWLSESPYKYDEARLGFEAYDERDHGDMVQMDICIPIAKTQ